MPVSLTKSALALKERKKEEIKKKKKKKKNLAYCTCVENIIHNCTQGRMQDFKLGGSEINKIFFFSNMHPYSINKLSTKKNTQKSLFHNISRSTF